MSIAQTPSAWLPQPCSGIAGTTTLQPEGGPIRPRRMTSTAEDPAQLTLAIASAGTSRPPGAETVEQIPSAESRAVLERIVPRLCAVVVEVIGGDRGTQQLLHWTTEEVYDELVRRSSALNAVVGGDQRLRRLRATIRSVRIFWPSAKAAEVSVHVRQGARSRALALRMELIDGRWRCSALQLG